LLVSRFRNIISCSLIVLAVILAGCQSTPTAEDEVSHPQAAPVAFHRCSGFFVYEICLADVEGDRVVDYVYFGDDLQIFMYREGVSLPDSMPLHRCRRPMTPEVTDIGSELLYLENGSLLTELDLKRRLLVRYLAAKDEVDECYGGDSSKGIRTDTVEEDFADDEFDWE